METSTPITSPCVNDDGTIPAKETPNWSTYNNYRQNIQGTLVKTVPLPDATSKRLAVAGSGRL